MGLDGLNLTKKEKVLILRDYFKRLETLSRRLSNLAAREISYPFTEKQQKALDRRRENMEAEARDIAGAMGFKVYFQRDPRGCYIYLIPPDIPDHEIDQRYLEGIAF